MPNYLYNGVELPALPEWDKATYPYAVIAEYQTMAGLYGYHLIVSNVPLYMTDNFVWQVTDDSSTLHVLCSTIEDDLYPYFEWNTSDSAWHNPHDGITHGVMNWDKAIWANYDIEMCDGNFNPLGTIGLYASDPVPVGGEPTPQDFYITKNGVGQKQDVYLRVGGQSVKLDEYKT